MDNRVTHFEIPYDDAGRAEAFYAGVFGWQISHMPEMDYTSVVTGPMTDEGIPTEPGFISGGMTKRQEPLTSPVITIEVPSIDDALGAVEKHGGSTVVPRQAAGDMGFFAYFTDPEGNVMGLWENA